MGSKNDPNWVPWAGDPSQSFGALGGYQNTPTNEYLFKLPPMGDPQFFNNLAYQVATDPIAHQQYATAYFQGSPERHMMGIPMFIAVPAPVGWWPTGGMQISMNGEMVYADGTFTTI